MRYVGNEMPLTKSQLQRINDCLDMMSKRLDEAEAQRQERWDADDRELAEELFNGNTMPVAPSVPFADSPPERIHGQPDQELWPPKPRTPFPIETL
jgi:hypothetical protein